MIDSAYELDKTIDCKLEEHALSEIFSLFKANLHA